MLNISLIELAKILGVRYQGKTNIFAQGVAIDSRKVKDGDLFFAMSGENADGHCFVEKAIENGAVGAVITDISLIKRPESKNLILCPDPLDFLQRLAKLIRENNNIPVIAITGSTGKTTTKDMVFSILQQKYKTLKTEGNYNNEIGLPITSCKLDHSHEALVLEMGMRDLGQIDFLCQIAKPNYAIITNIGITHAEILGSQENIAKAKAEILLNLPSDGYVMLNTADKELLLPFLKDFHGQVAWFGFEKDADFGVKEILELGERGSSFILANNQEEILIEINIPGEHNILNSLAAIGIARCLGLEWSLIKQGLKNICPTEMRLQMELTALGAKIINDAYNANPASMEAALKVLVSTKGKRKIAVLGDMYELGIYQEEGHEKVGEIVHDLGVDILIAVGNLGEIIGVKALSVGMDKAKVFIASDNQGAISILKNIVESEDVVLVKGSRGTKMEDIVLELMG